RPDTAKAERVINWKTVTDFKVGLNKTISWLRTY
ncbi:unnamed protein product, partial [marine sediment metagenome]